MSLEWARARLLQYREALRKLCEAHVPVPEAQPRILVTTLRPGPLRHPLPQAHESGTVLKFAQPARRRRA